MSHTRCNGVRAKITKDDFTSRLVVLCNLCVQVLILLVSVKGTPIKGVQLCIYESFNN